MNASHWDQRFAAHDYLFGTEPNVFLRREVTRLPTHGRVLAIADGEGRNGVYLAQHGFDVVATDISPAGLAKARRLANQRGVALTLKQVDLAHYDWPEANFDAVVAIFVQFAEPMLRASMFSGFIRTLRPGGILLLEGYRPEQLRFGTGGPKAEENLYTESLLRTSFAELEILDISSYDVELDEGAGHNGMSAVIDLIARKPL